MDERRLLLHVCCAPCATHPVRVLSAQGFAVSLHFFNPNIHPPAEHDLRAAEAIRFAESAGLSIVSAPPDYDGWDAAVRGLEGEPEGGKRCDACFRFRLAATAAAAAAGGFDAFASTLSLSPHKSPSAIDAAGSRAAASAGVEYLPTDFKKKGGFQESVRLSRDMGMYRQSFCGCRYSRRDR